MSDVFECQEQWCSFRVLKTPADAGKSVIAHSCPHRSTITFGWSESIVMVEQLWERLDKEIDKVMDPDLDAALKADAKARAGAFAEVIHQFMSPVLAMVSDVKKEGMLRYKARQAGETRVTPGMMHARWKTLTDGSPWYPSGAGYTDHPDQASRMPTEDEAVGAFTNRAKGIFQGMTSEPKAKRAPAITIPEADWPTIRDANKNGFSAADLAKVYSTTTAQINLVLASS